ncbi:MAG: DUF4157 domain-containing protein [Chitinophagales bacterium]|nr:DUF4157 domain-containing protein [Chitinophagales bacterium]
MAFYNSRSLSGKNNSTKDKGSSQPFFSSANATQAFFQPKLTINQAGDKYEQEANAMAEKVVSQSALASAQSSSGTISPKCEECEKENQLQRMSMPEEEQVQAKPLMRTVQGGNTATPQLASQLNNTKGRGNSLPQNTLLSMNQAFGTDFSNVRVHTDSQAREMSQGIQAKAFTHGSDIYFNKGQYNPGSTEGKRLLGHELTHVVQQGGSENAKTDRGTDASKGLHSEASASGSIQRAVRIGGGSTRVTEADYMQGGNKSSVGSRYLVSDLINDNVRRVFNDVNELEAYANGQTDYIGDVVTSSAGTYWYRLPENQLIILGERHQNPQGNVEDVIIGLNTARFMYEPYNELASVAALNIPFTGTEGRLSQVHSGLRTANLVNRTNFNPDLENIVFKALAGASLARNEYIANDPPNMPSWQVTEWQGRPTTNDYSIGERTALYLAIGIRIASDIAQHDFGPQNFVESLFISSGRRLKENYLQNQAVLDQFMQTKEGDDLIGIYELTSPNNFQNLQAIRGFTLALHEYASFYIEQLGQESGNATLVAEGQSLATNTNVGLQGLSPAREEIMWQKIQHANSNSYLIVGMGDAHRVNLTPRLNQAGITHEEVSNSLERQKNQINGNWTP